MLEQFSDTGLPESAGAPLTRNSAPPSPDWRALLAMLVGAGLSTALLARAPLFGHDWVVYFAHEAVAYQYPPWVTLILKPLAALPPRSGLAVLHGFTVSTVAVLTYFYGRRTYPAARAPAIIGVVFALANPVLWSLLWLGQIEVVALLGVVTLPAGIPLLFAKPNIAPWAAFNSWRNVILMGGLMLASLAIWPGWIVPFLDHVLHARIPFLLAMGWGALHPLIGVIGLLMFLVTDRDPIRLMAAGSFISPFMMPYHYYLLLPALGRISGYRQIALWLSSFPLLAVPAIPTTPVKLIALLFPLLAWALTAPTLNPREMLADPDLMLNRIRATLKEMGQWLMRQATLSDADAA